MTRPLATIVAAIIIDNGRVLMVRRRLAEGGLSWQFPAGQVEADETPFDAAIRETLEETGLDVVPTLTIGDRVHPETGRQIIYVGCEATPGSMASLIDAEELSAVEWCDRQTLEAHVPAGLYEPVRQYLIGQLSADAG